MKCWVFQGLSDRTTEVGSDEEAGSLSSSIEGIFCSSADFFSFVMLSRLLLYNFLLKKSFF